MKLNFLWRLSFLSAFLLTLILQSLWLVFLYWSSPQFTFSEYTAGIIIGLPAAALLFGLLLRLPKGSLIHRVAYEFLALAAILFIMLVGIWMIYTFHELGQPFRLLTAAEQAEFGTWDWQAFILLIILQLAVSIPILYIGLRFLIRPYLVWNQMREKRLVWEITHAQLNLLVSVMIILFLVIAIQQIITQVQPGSSPSTFVYNTIIALLAAAGALGILTAIMVIFIILPAMAVSYLAARRITKRIDSLVDATQEIRRGRYETKIVVKGEDEITQLQENFNAMVKQLAETRSALETERDTVSNLLESRRRLFADVSHELRTPIATIRSYLESMERTESSAQDIDIMEREILRLQRLMDDVFTLAKSDLEQLKYTIAPFNLKPILERTTQAAKQVAWQTRKVDVILEPSTDILTIQADSERVEQILYNLLRNAIRHTMPGGFILVRSIIETQFICIEVQDTGEGIPETQLANIWERFYRRAETRASDTQGAGLGLALVKEMTEAMHGKVAVRSKVGEGSCFTICLPRVVNDKN